MKVTSREKAWEEVNEIFPTDYEKDEASSLRAGYDIYRHATLNYYNRICDLGCRLEVLTGEYGENVTNIWIVEEVKAEETATKPAYGEALAEQLRKTVDTSKITDFEKFVLDRGYEFKTKEALQNGYDRRWKAAHSIAITESEFITEAQGLYPDNYDVDTLKEVYARLMDLVAAKKLKAGEVYGYANFKWCLRNPDAITAYQAERDRWHVNNCGTEVSKDEAIVAVNAEWGFEASRIKIIGTPFYDATDYQFIRFDCAHIRASV